MARAAGSVHAGDRVEMIKGRFAAIWLACRLAAWGGTPLLLQHRAVQCFRSLAWALLGCTDYGEEMRLLLAGARASLGAPCGTQERGEPL